MIRYDISKIAKRPKGTVVGLPPIGERAGTVVEYRTALRAIVREMARETREGVIPAYRTFNADNRLTLDAPEWFIRLRDLQRQLVGRAQDMVDRILRLEARRHSETFRRDVRRALGIDLKAVVRDEDLEKYLRDAVARNVSLISGLTDDLAKRIEQEVYAAKINGKSVKDLRKGLVKQFGFAAKRADLVAADQMGSINSDLNRIRQTQAGVTTYTWMTSRDERVRNGTPPRNHVVLDGKVYKWGEPTGAEGGLAPGQPIRCRCVPVGQVEF